MTNPRKALCHCGAVELAIEFTDGLKNLRRCDCSLCSRKGYIMASVPTTRLQITRGEEVLSLYKWGTQVAEHYFCSRCGIHTHHRRRSNPSEYGVNVACVEGVQALAIGEVPIGNGNFDLPLPPLQLPP